MHCVYQLYPIARLFSDAAPEKDRDLLSLLKLDSLSHPTVDGLWIDQEKTCSFEELGNSLEREGFQIGLATSKSPLGPFKRYGDKPVLPHGPKGSWDENNCACAMVLKDDDNKYYMFYSGLGYQPKYTGGWDIGFAVADNPLGPWKKYDKNPVLEDFGYLNSVVKVNGKYYLYTAHPVGSIASDYSPHSFR